MPPHGPFDWKLARDVGREDRRWPYDERLVADALAQLEAVVAGLDEIHDVTDARYPPLMSAHRWGGAAFHDAGWNARHLDGVDHAFLYCLEHQTGRSFIHGQAVGLGTYLGAVLQDNQPEVVLGGSIAPAWTSALRRWVSIGTRPYGDAAAGLVRPPRGPSPTPSPTPGR